MFEFLSISYHFRYFSKSTENSVEEETEVRRNLEALFSTQVESAFESVLSMERSLVDVVDQKSASHPVLIFRDEANQLGVFGLIVELALQEGHPSPLYVSAESCDTLDVNQLVCQQGESLTACTQGEKGGRHFCD